MVCVYTERTEFYFLDRNFLLPDFGGREVGTDSLLKILFSIAKQKAACYNMTK